MEGSKELTEEKPDMYINEDKVATIHFTIKDEKGIVQDTTKGQPPYSFLGSSGQMFPNVEEKLAGMKAGEKESMLLEPADAYGDYDKNAVKITARSHFPEGVEIKEGTTFLTQQQGHEVPVIIKKIENDEVTIDFNHPLAGQKLEMDFELVELRDATEEELTHDHAHGPGCSH